MEYNNVIQLARDLKTQINNYNVKKITREQLVAYVNEVLSCEKNCAMMYRGNSFSTTFIKTISKWRLEILKDIIADIKG